MSRVLRHIRSICGQRRRPALLAAISIVALVAALTTNCAPAGADNIVPATTAETVQYVPGQQECGVIAPGQADSGELGCYTYTPVSPSSLLSVGGTPAEQAALGDLEQQAVSNTLAEHGLPTSDAPTVLVRARPDVEANLWALLWQALQEKSAGRALDDQNGAVAWLGSLLQPQYDQAAVDEGLEYTKWAGLDMDRYNFLVGTNAGSAALTSFLSQAPEAQAQGPGDGPGYCNYVPPAPDQGDYSNQGDENCFTACTSILGCTPPYPTQQQFQQWGTADVADQFSQDLPADYSWHAAEVATALDFGGATLGALGSVVGGAAAGSALSGGGALASALASSVLRAAIFPFAGNVSYVSVEAAEAAAAEGGDAAADAAAEAAGTAAAELVGAVATVVATVFEVVVTAVLQGIQVAADANLPGNIANDVLNPPVAEPTKALTDTNTAQDLYALFINSIPSAPQVTVCPALLPENEMVPGAIATGTSLQQGGCDALPSPGAAPDDPFFCVVGASSVPSDGQDPCAVPDNDLTSAISSYFSNSISWRDTTGSSETTGSARLSGNWFVEQTTPAGGSTVTAQTLQIHYTDWSGKGQTAWLEQGSSGGYEFVGVPDTNAASTQSGDPFDPSTCVTGGTCWASPSIDFVGTDGKDYSAWALADQGGPIVSPNDSTNQVDGQPETFGALGRSPLGLPITYQWEFQNPWIYSGGRLFCFSPCQPFAAATGPKVQYTWPASGTWQVWLIATDSLGRSVVYEFDVVVGTGPIGVALGPPAQVDLGTPSTVSGRITSGADDEETVTVSWGDGAVDSGQIGPNTEPAPLPGVPWPTGCFPGLCLGTGDSSSGSNLLDTHTYAKPGEYGVTVSVGVVSATTDETVVGSQAITWQTQTRQPKYGQRVQFLATGGSSGSPVVLQPETPNVCRISAEDHKTSAGGVAFVVVQVDLLAAGTCTITADQAAGNYYSAAPTSTQSFLVQPDPLTVRADNATMTYGGAVPSITPVYAGFLADDTAASLSTGPTCSTTATNASPVGTYASTCSGAVDPNYAISYTDGTVAVGPATLTVTATSSTMTYGGPVPSITPVYAGLVAGDTAASLSTGPTCSTTATNASPVGTYASTCSGAVDPNYAISYADGTVTILPASPATPSQTTMTTTPPADSGGSPGTTGPSGGTSTAATTIATGTTVPTGSSDNSGSADSTTTSTAATGSSDNSGSADSTTSTSAAGTTGTSVGIGTTTGTTGPAVTTTTTGTPGSAGSGSSTAGTGSSTTTGSTTDSPGSSGGTGSSVGTGSSGGTGSAGSSGISSSGSSGSTATGTGSLATSGSAASIGGHGSPGGNGASTTNKPVILSLSPAVGPRAGGTRVVITGKWFENVGHVSFGSRNAHFEVVSAQKVIAEAPPGAGTVVVAVVTTAGSSDPSKGSRHSSFSYLARSQVLQVSPAIGPKAGGTKVRVEGKGFQDVENVRFGTHDASFQVVSQTELVAQAPPGNATVAIEVTTPGGTSAKSKPGLFTYLANTKK
jgi:hypothetical protein